MNKHIKKLKSILKKDFRLTNDDIDCRITSLTEVIRFSNDPDDAIEIFLQNFNIRNTTQGQALISSLEFVIDHIGLWELKGHSMAEIFDRVDEPKLGPIVVSESQLGDDRDNYC